MAAQPWFKCINPRNPAMTRFIDEFGDAGLGCLVRVLAECQVQGTYSIDFDTFKSWAHLKSDRAKKLWPLLSKILEETQKILSKSQEISKNLEQISGNLEENLGNLRKSQDFTPSNPLPDCSLIEENRIEEIRVEENRVEGPQEKTTAAKNKRGVRLPPDWQPSDVLADWVKTTRPDLAIADSVDRFRDYWIAKPGEAGVKLDWDATFRNWIRNERGQNLGQTQSRASHERLHGSDIVPAEQRQGGILTLWE